MAGKAGRTGDRAPVGIALRPRPNRPDRRQDRRPTTPPRKPPRKSDGAGGSKGRPPSGVPGDVVKRWAAAAQREEPAAPKDEGVGAQRGATEPGSPSASASPRARSRRQLSWLNDPPGVLELKAQLNEMGVAIPVGVSEKPELEQLLNREKERRWSASHAPPTPPEPAAAQSAPPAAASAPHPRPVARTVPKSKAFRPPAGTPLAAWEQQKQQQWQQGPASIRPAVPRPTPAGAKSANWFRPPVQPKVAQAQAKATWIKELRDKAAAEATASSSQAGAAAPEGAPAAAAPVPPVPKTGLAHFHVPRRGFEQMPPPRAPPPPAGATGAAPQASVPPPPRSRPAPAGAPRPWAAAAPQAEHGAAGAGAPVAAAEGAAKVAPVPKRLPRKGHADQQAAEGGAPGGADGDADEEELIALAQSQMKRQTQRDDQLVTDFVNQGGLGETAQLALRLLMPAKLRQLMAGREALLQDLLSVPARVDKDKLLRREIARLDPGVEDMVTKIEQKDQRAAPEASGSGQDALRAAGSRPTPEEDERAKADDRRPRIEFSGRARRFLKSVAPQRVLPNKAGGQAPRGARSPPQREAPRPWRRDAETRRLQPSPARAGRQGAAPRGGGGRSRSRSRSRGGKRGRSRSGGRGGGRKGSRSGSRGAARRSSRRRPPPRPPRPAWVDRRADRVPSRSRSFSRGRGGGDASSARRGREPAPQPKQPEGGHAADEVTMWLHSLDDTGAMSRYEKVLRESFGSLHQLRAAATQAPEPGKSPLACIEPAVFEILNMEVLGHKLLFAKGIVALSSGEAAGSRAR